MPTGTSGPTEVERRDALAGRLFEATLDAFDLLAIHLGDELRLYRTHHDTFRFCRLDP